MSPSGYGYGAPRRGGLKLLPVLLFGLYLAYYYFSLDQAVETSAGGGRWPTLAE